MKHPKMIIVLLGLLLFVISACHTREHDLSFESIAQGDFINYREEQSAVFVIANNDGIDALVPNVLAEDPALINQLRQLDYNRFFAILVLQGLKGQGGYSVAVQRVYQQGDQINVEVEFTEPAPSTRRIQAFTSPYHLVVVSKQGEWGRQMNFALVSDSEEVAVTSHFIP